MVDGLLGRGVVRRIAGGTWARTRIRGAPHDPPRGPAQEPEVVVFGALGGLGSVWGPVGVTLANPGGYFALPGGGGGGGWQIPDLKTYAMDM